MHWFTYILRCADDSYYVGRSQNPKERTLAHNLGNGAKYTKYRRPVSLLYSELYDTEAKAAQRERQLKKWSRAKKEALIQGNLKALNQFASRRKR